MAEDRRGAAPGMRGRGEPGERFRSDQRGLGGRFLAQRAGGDAVRGRLKMPQEPTGCARIPLPEMGKSGNLICEEILINRGWKNYSIFVWVGRFFEQPEH